MKKVRYFCPKHQDVILWEEEQIENPKDVAEKYVIDPIAWFLIVNNITHMACHYCGIGHKIGPFYCEKCDKNYFKWDCQKDES